MKQESYETRIEYFILFEKVQKHFLQSLYSIDTFYYILNLIDVLAFLITLSN